MTPQLNRNGIITLAIPADIITNAGGNTSVDRNFEYQAPTQPNIIDFDWPDVVNSGVGTFFLDIDFNVNVTGLTTSDFILDAPSSVSITSITWGTTPIATSNRLRVRAGTLATVGADGKQYYRINFTTTSGYAGQIINLELKSNAVLGPAPVNS